MKINLRLLICLFVSICSHPLYAQLTLTDVQTVIAQAATRAAQISPNTVIAVTDREGNVLGVWDVNGGVAPSAAEIGIAVSKAGTAAYLSSNQQALTSRTAGFIIQQHFPPFVSNRPPGPLVGVGFSNLPHSDINRFRAPAYPTLAGGILAGVTPVLNTSLNGSPGGVPLYKGGILVGGVGITGDGNEQFVPSGPTINEDVALAGQIGFAPSSEFFGSHVFIDGIRLTYVESTTSLPSTSPFGSIGNVVAAYPLSAAPAALAWPSITLGGVLGEIRSPIISDAAAGTVQGATRLTAAEVQSIITLAAQRAMITRARIRLPRGMPAQVFITVVNNPYYNNATEVVGVTPAVLGVFRAGTDATLFSWDVAVQKARTAVFFSNQDRAQSCRTVGFMAQTLFPPGIDSTFPGPYNGIQERFSNPGSAVAPNANLQNGITIFPGGFPLYRNGQVIGAIGVSGDGVDEDDIIAASGTVNFLADKAIRADRVGYHGARLPYAKFPRQPVR